MKGLTPRQREVFNFIREFIRLNRYPPTIREIATNFRFSVKGSYDHVKALEKKAYLRCHENRSRAIEILRDAEAVEDEVASVPLLGNVAAGRPLFAEENLQGYVQIPAASLGKSTHFALQVKGDSMKDAGILDGDLLAVHRSSEARAGQVIVARLDDEVTVKRFKKNGHVVELLPENPDFEPILVDLRRQELVIEGIGVGVIRQGKDL